MMSEMFLWGGLIQADIALPVILGRVGWTLCEWSGRRDSNPRSLGPEPSAIPGFATSRRLEFLARSTGHSVPRSRTECPSKLSTFPQACCNTWNQSFADDCRNFQANGIAVCYVKAPRGVYVP